MARKIELEFYDKKYTIEYNRASVKEIFAKKSEDDIEQVVALIKGGLILHHKDDMPSDDDIIGWVIALGKDLEPFATALKEMVQEVINTFESDRKNLKWRKV